MPQLSSLIAFISVASLGFLVACRPQLGGSFDFLEGETGSNPGEGGTGSNFLPLFDDPIALQLPESDSISLGGTELAFLDDNPSTSPFTLADASSSFLIANNDDSICPEANRWPFCCASSTDCAITSDCTNNQVLNCCTIDPGCTPDTFHDCAVVKSETSGGFLGGSNSDPFGNPSGGFGF